MNLLIAAMMDDDDDLMFDQPCKYGLRCEHHAVYCENPKMPQGKCHRTWYTGGETRDEDCVGYEAREG